MKAEITVPAMGESITEATIGELIRQDGADVTMDEEILELETDKVNQVLYAPQAGKLNLTVKVDDVVKIGDVIGYVDTEGAAAPAAPAKEEPAPQAAKEAPPPPPAKGPAAPAASEVSARRMQGEFLADLKKPAAAPAAATSSTPAVVQPTEPETRERMPKIRQVIAKRLLEAQQTTAMLTTFNEVDMTAVMGLRSAHKDAFLDQHGVQLGFMSFFVKAAVAALQAVPRVNAYIDGDEIVQRHTYDIGIAVGTERGLVVPVVRGCDQMNFAQIEQGINDYAQKARTGGISVDDLQGGGFTITNGGIYGSLLSTPILNPPQSGILGMHKIQKRPVVIGDEIVVRPMMYLALSYDHRIVDGKEAVTFLVAIKDALEDPARLLLNL